MAIFQCLQEKKYVLLCCSKKEMLDGSAVGNNCAEEILVLGEEREALGYISDAEELVLAVLTEPYVIQGVV